MVALEGKTALITGASGNLGKSVARKFAAQGARLVLLERSTGHLQQGVSELAQSADVLLLESVDVGDPQQMQQAVEKAVLRFGRVDILINAVGGYQGGLPLHETSMQTWEAMMNINARTVFVASQAVIPYLLRQKSGRIVNVASRAGLAGGANLAAYSAAKSAVIRLTESMAAELGPHGINVNCVLPGTMDTPQNRHAMPEADPSQWVSTDSVAEVILFLASDGARDVNGAAVPVAGKG